ncbi:MAG: hypothetical protein KC492_22025, partial [Myxococcales bacterium]|nr:hypothetical protein [Myxococcales bacterium]
GHRGRRRLSDGSGSVAVAFQGTSPPDSDGVREWVEQCLPLAQGDLVSGGIPEYFRGLGALGSGFFGLFEGGAELPRVN